MSKNIVMTDGSVKETIYHLTIPMIFGIMGLIIFNLVDTYFVSMLGTAPLAALSFTYPVVLTLNSITLGIGVGTSSVVSRAIGENNKEHIKRYATDSLVLGTIIAAFFVVAGLMTIDPLFKLLGADSVTLPLIRSYMRIWYIGTVFVVIPMIGNNTIRALGDARTPSVIMVVAASVNSVLDPILIFGLGPFPRLEVAGAAIATVLSRMITFSVALYVLSRREKILSMKKTSLRRVLESWKKILYIGVPNALIRIIQPIGVGIITGLMARFGMEAVAGFGIAAKVERFAIVIIGALVAILVPFFGQNYGARRYDRIKEGLKVSSKLIVVSSVIIYGILLLFSRQIGLIFSDDPLVIDVFKSYITLVPLFYAAYGFQLMGNSFFNAINKPVMAVSITAFQIFVFIPTAFIMSNSYDEKGIFMALSLSFLMAGGLAYVMINNKIKGWNYERRSNIGES
jgi:putative MATE family efflux protein